TPNGSGKVLVSNLTLDTDLTLSGKTANSILFIDSDKKVAEDSDLTFDTDTKTLSLDGQMNVDNLRLDSNTLSSTNINGNIIISPNGTGSVGVGTSSPNSS